MSRSNSARAYRIGIDARFYRRSTAGIGRYSRELLRGLAELDQVNEYTVFLTKEDFLEWEPVGPNFTPVVVEIPHYSVEEQTQFLRILLKYRFDLVHFLNFNHPILYRRPFVVTLHDVTMLLFPDAARKSTTSLLRRKAFEYIFKRALHAAKRVIAISENSALDAERHLKVPHAKMEVIYNGGPVKQKVPFGAKTQVQEYLGRREPYILFLSQWRGHKGILTLLDAFADFKARTKAPHILVLLGKQDAAPLEVRQAIASSPVSADIVTPGFAPDELLPSLLTYASVFTVPSEYEGFGLPVLEALTYGAPTVVADNSSLPEVGGEAVLYFPTRDAGALSQQIERLVTDRELVEELRSQVPKQLAKFSWQQAAEQTLRLYYSILEKGR